VDWFRPLGVAGLAWRSVATVVGRVSLWVPSLILAVAQLLVLLVLLFFHLSPLVPVAGPLVRLLGGESATHYPAHILALPIMLDRASLALEVLLAWVVLGVTTLRFADAFGVEQQESSWAGARRRAGALAAVVGSNVVARVGLMALLAASPVGARLGSWGELACHLLVGLLVQAVLAYAAAYLLLHQRGLWSALTDSYQLARRNVATTLILVGAPMAMVLPLSVALLLLRPFAPAHDGLVAAVAALRVAAGVLANVVLVGAVTRLFVAKTRTSR
jgi:hypothetical protein